MLRKLRRAIVKPFLEKSLLRELKCLKLLEEKEKAVLEFEYDAEYFVSFNLKTENNLFQKVYFTDKGKDKGTILVVFKKSENYETMEFSVSKLLFCIYPKRYTIKPIKENKFDAIQNIDIFSGKITLSMCLCEYEGEATSSILNSLMEKMSEQLFKRDMIELNIIANDCGEKIYWINAVLLKLVYKPETKVNLKQFDSLKKYFN